MPSSGPAGAKSGILRVLYRKSIAAVVDRDEKYQHELILYFDGLILNRVTRSVIMHILAPPPLSTGCRAQERVR